ncbi:MAG: glucokinase [Betaproteobacteria bacterium]|nr:glucokinase [Betaproteobacteria bacterium]
MARAAEETILCVDLGGTKTLLELSSVGAVAPRFERRYLAADHAGFIEMLRHFVDEFARETGTLPRIAAGCLCVAGPIEGDRVRVTQLPWEFGADAVAAEFGIGRLRLVNDFEACAHGIDVLQAGDLLTLQSGRADPRGHRVVLGAGTGLGVAYSIWTGHGRRAIAGEGGHAGFAPRDELQCELWRDVHAQAGYVSCEHLLSGAGIERIYGFLQRRAGGSTSSPGGAQRIAESGLSGEPLAAAALALFASIFGAVAGDHALGAMTRGGVYLAGGIAPKVLPHAGAAQFIEAFRAKGVHQPLMDGFPVHVVLNERLGLMGARRMAGELIQVKLP